MANHTSLASLFSDIANAIRAKTGGSGNLVADNFPTAISQIPTGITPTGTINITQNGDHNVTNYATAHVNVPTGGGVTGWTVKQLDAVNYDEGSLIFSSDQEITAVPTAYIVYSLATNSSLEDGSFVALLHDSSTHKAWIYSNGNATEVDNPVNALQYSSSGHRLYLDSRSYIFNDANYGVICIFGGEGNFTFRTASYQPPSGVVAGQFSVDENPPLYFCGLDSSVAANQYHRVQTVVKLEDGDFCGTNFYTNTLGFYDDFTESYSNGTLTITSSGTNNGGYFHNPGIYTLFYALQEDLDGTGNMYQSKTVTPTTSQQVVEADTGYEALKRVTVQPIPSQYIVPTGNKAITENGNNIDVAQYSTVSVNVPQQGGGGTVASATKTVSGNTSTSIQFTNLSGTPKAFFLRLTTQIARSSSNRYYYVENVRYNGTNTNGRYFYQYNGTLYNDTSHYSYTYSNGTLTISSSGSQSGAGGSFYGGTYELVYVY